MIIVIAGTLTMLRTDVSKHGLPSFQTGRRAALVLVTVNVVIIALVIIIIIINLAAPQTVFF
jgi:hypothetical protein